jgi:hypothetical protein
MQIETTMKKITLYILLLALSASFMNSEKVIQVTELTEYRFINHPFSLVVDSMLNTYDYSCHDDVNLNRDSLLRASYGFSCVNNTTGMALKINAIQRNGSSAPTYWFEPMYTNKVLCADVKNNINSFVRVGRHRIVFDNREIRLKHLFKLTSAPTEKFCLVDNNKSCLPGFPIDSHFVIGGEFGGYKVMTAQHLDCSKRP